jgi:hypothetical protein
MLVRRAALSTARGARIKKGVALNFQDVIKSEYLLCLLLQDNGIRVLTGLVSNR